MQQCVALDASQCPRLWRTVQSIPHPVRFGVAALGAISLILLGAQSASAATPPAMPAGLNPVHVAVSPDGTKAYAANGTFPGTITVLDLATNTAVSTVGVGDAPEGIAFSPTQPKAYVTSRNDAIFSVVDTTTN